MAATTLKSMMDLPLLQPVKKRLNKRYRVLGKGLKEITKRYLRRRNIVGRLSWACDSLRVLKRLRKTTPAVHVWGSILLKESYAELASLTP